MVSSRFMFPQGRVDFNPPILGVVDPVQLNPSFTAAITSALGQSTKAAQREALYTVFNTYGHVFRTKVRLGGSLSAHTMETINRSVRPCNLTCLVSHAHVPVHSAGQRVVHQEGYQDWSRGRCQELGLQWHFRAWKHPDEHHD